MKLLSAEEIKKEKDKTENDRFKRIEKLKKEEDILIKTINNLTEEERDLAVIKKIAKLKNQPVINIKKSILEKEVDILEKRKQEALEPVYKTKREADELKKEFEFQLKEALKKKKELERDRESIIEKGLELKSREESVIEKQERQSNREVGIKAAEEEIKRSTKELSEKWVSYHEEVNKVNLDIDKRSSELLKRENQEEAQRKTNDSILKELSEERNRLDKEDKAIQDKYRTLGAAQREILGK